MLLSMGTGALLLVLAGLGRSASAAAPETGKAFEQRLIADLTRAVTPQHERMHAAKAAGQKRADRGYSWVLPAFTVLHSKTGDRKFLDWAKEDILWMTESAIESDGRARAFLTSFRNLQPFCEAYLYLRERKALDDGESRKIAAQISASARSHYDYTDWGGHNRSDIDAASFYYAAAAVPGDPDAGKWKKYGEALMHDSWGRWSIEDASIYNPFWLVYLMTTGELHDRTAELMNAIPVRFYFEYYSRLLMPNNMMPDWGDGDWTHMWQWYTAAMVRAGSYYKNGRYLDYARRLYSYYADKRLAGDEVYCAATALRWLDAGVPFEPYTIRRSEEVVDELISKKITFRNDRGPQSAYGLLTYRDMGPYGRYQRDYLNQQLAAYEEKPHHGHADENSIAVLMDGETVLLADGGYRENFTEGWRADVYHNRVSARAGWPSKGDLLDYFLQNRTYSEVRTELVHFGNFGSFDYSRTRLIDETLGYAGDRVILFLPATGMYVVADSIRIDRAGHKTFVNAWHPDNILKQGDNYVVSWPKRIPIRKEYWDNKHAKDLLIQFLDNRDKTPGVKEIHRRFNESKTFYQSVSNYFFAGQRLTFVTVLAPHAAGAFAEQMLRRVEVLPGGRDGRSLGLRIDTGAGKAVVGLKLDQTIGLTNLKGRPMFDWETGALSYGDLKTDADFAFVLDKDSELEYGFMYACRLENAGEVLFDMPLNRHMYQGAAEYRVPNIKDKMPRWHDVVRRGRSAK